MNYTKKPEMIFFDVGGTLFDDGKCIPEDGFEALRRVAENPDATTAGALAEKWNEFFIKAGSLRSEAGGVLEIPLSAVIKYAVMSTGLNIPLSVYEQEEIFDRFNSSRTVIDGVNDLLSTLHRNGIRSAVISNNAMIGESLTLSVNRFIPDNCFEFCLTSADILFTKPSAEIFLAAANKAGVSPENCWYCGDSLTADIIGAAVAGMTPVLLDRKADTALGMRNADTSVCYMAVNNWKELTRYLSEL